MDQDPGRRVDSWHLSGTELRSVLSGLPADEYDRFVAGFDQVTSGRLFLSGQGRSGLAAQMAAMRFMHLGLAAHFVGEATAPSVRSGDTLVIVSGSGRTPVSVGFARIATSQGARVLLVTHQRESPLRDLADSSIVLPAATSQQFGGTLFEQSALILLDSVVLELMRTLPDPDATMSYNHTNLQ
ncbi:SIS domain-containing protein [Micromonospora sp. CPCC 205546]|uniref:SIS domain-containing protein n=1 Tax=unclassified Micromonospora TaxID=2617518 RepID=UPI002FF09D15|nr:SIS domain-containing protein [Micromonospora sp. NBC_01638]